MRRIFWLMVAATVCCSATAHAGCKADSDCKRKRVCVNGACVSPDKAVPQQPAPAPEPVAAPAPDAAPAPAPEAAPEPTPAPTVSEASARKRVQSYLQLAADLMKSSNWADALEELQRADELLPSSEVRLNMGRCLEELHREMEALSAFERCAATEDASPNAKSVRTSARDAVARLQARLLGTLVVTCPEGAVVEVGNLTPHPLPCPATLTAVRPASYLVKVSKAGLPQFRLETAVGAGKRSTVAATLSPEPTPIVVSPPPQPQPQPAPAPAPTAPPETPAPVAVATPAPASVPAQAAPAAAAPIVDAGPATVSRPMSGRKVGGILTIVGGGLVLGCSGLFVGLSAQQKSSIQGGGLATENDIQGAASNATTYNRVSLSFLIIGVAAAATGIVLVATTPSEAAPGPSLTLVPAAFAGGAGLAVSGRLP